MTLPLTRNVVILLLLSLVGLGLVLVQPANASFPKIPPAQPTPFLTPTPGPDGIIIYIVQEGDSLWRIAAIAGITVEE
ncbi:MAG: LysM domain-containing protein, partial [Anaerolineales bacterium]